MNAPIDRRRLLQLLVALGASPLVNWKPAFAASGSCGGAVFGELDPAAIQELGRKYLAQRPGTTVEGIAKLLASSRNEAEASAQLRAQMRADFTAGRIVNLAGWFVSETEGCVFAALSRCR